MTITEKAGHAKHRNHIAERDVCPKLTAEAAQTCVAKSASLVTDRSEQCACNLLPARRTTHPGRGIRENFLSHPNKTVSIIKQRCHGHTRIIIHSTNFFFFFFFFFKSVK